MKMIGYWNNDSRVELYELDDGRQIAVSNWNGEIWGECWEVFPDGSTGERFEARPVYRYQKEDIDLTTLDENSPEWDHATEIVDIS